MSWAAPGIGHWSGIDWAPAAARAGSDPYLVWADLTAFAAMGGTGSLAGGQAHVILEMHPESGAVELEARLAAAGWGHVGPLYLLDPSPGPRFCTASVTREFFGDWRTLGVLRYGVCEPRVGANLAIPQFALPENGLAGGVPLIGVIDDGLPYLHSAFRYGAVSRVIAFWDQGRGVVLDRADIKHVLEAFVPGQFDRVNEAAAYADAGYARMSVARAHGAAVMGLCAAGRPHEIACVQLPARTVADSSGGSLAAQALEACHYILSQAAPSQPVVINLSYGGHAGPHDGTGLLEAALDELCSRRPQSFAVVLAAGNAYASRCHARLAIPEGGSARFVWEVPDDDATESFLEIWAEGAAHAGVQVRLRPPGAGWSGSVGPSEASVAVEPGSVPWCLVSNSVSAGNGRHHVLVCLGPTSPERRTGRTPAPAGAWEVEITTLGKALTVDAWVERDGPIYPYGNGGKQSVLADPQGAGYIDPAGTLSNIANGRETIVVGAHVESSGDPSWYSSMGMGTRGAVRSGPEVTAPGDESVVKSGVEVIGNVTDEASRMNGTSVAAPQVAAMVADYFADPAQPADRASLKVWLAQRAQADDQRYTARGDPPLPPERAGAGRIKP